MADETLSIDISAWTRKVALLGAATGKNMREVLDEEWPLLMRKIVDFTPPKTLAQGRAAVNRDIRKTMRPFDPALVRTEGVREIVARKNIEAFNLVAGRAHGGPLQGARAVPFSPEIHTSARNARGRVTTSQQNRVVLGSDAQLLKRYLKTIQDRVGWAKAGWLQALHLLGETAASYIERHSPGSGRVIDDRDNPDNPSITAVNRTPWAVRKDEAQRIIGDAYDSRVVAIFSKVKTKLRLAVKESGFDMAA